MPRKKKLANKPDPVLFFRAHSSHSQPDFNGDCDYAFVVLTEERIREILHRMDLAAELYAKDRTVMHVLFADLGAQFFSTPNDSAFATAKAAQAFEDLTGELFDADYVVTDGSIIIPESAYQRTELDYLDVAICGGPEHVDVWWQASPKHCDGVTVEGGNVPRSVFEALLKKG